LADFAIVVSLLRAALTSCFRVTFYQCIATMSLLEEDPYLRDLLLHDEGDLLNEMYAWPTRDLLDYKSRLARFYDRASPYHGSVRCLPSSLNYANPNLHVKCAIEHVANEQVLALLWNERLV